MAPSYYAVGAMVYLADVESRRVLRGTVGFLQAVLHLQTPTNAASKHSLGTAFLLGSNPCPSGPHLKSFLSEQNETRTLCLNKK